MWSIAAIPRAEDVDSGSYRLMARGEPACRPYANRILHPALAGLLGYGAEKKRTIGQDDKTTMGQENQFHIIAIISSIVFYLSVLSLLRDVRPRWLVFVLLISPLWWVWGGNIYIQDMFAAALTALLLLLLRSLDQRTAPNQSPISNPWFSIPLILFLLQLTRESTTLLSLALIVLALWHRRWWLAMGAFVAMAAGMAVVAWASRDALPGANGLDGGVYLVAKAIANGVRNFTGVIPWNDGYAARLPWYYPDPPAWKCTLPTFLQMGNVHEVGIYKFMPGVVLRTFALWLLYFPGVILLLPKCASRTRGQEDEGTSERTAQKFSIRRSPFYVQYSFVIGLAFWLLAPFSGASLERLVGYAWPLFWVALPMSFIYNQPQRRQLKCKKEEQET